MQRWAERFGLVPGAAEQQRLARWGQGRMAGYVAPGASVGELELLACWGAFITLVDDGFDRPHPMPSANVEAVLAPLVAVVSGSDSGSAGATPAVTALRDLWRRTAVGTGTGWRKDFAAAYASFAEATCEEARWRESGFLPSLEEYIRLRRRTITVVPLLLVTERLHTEAPSAEGLHDVCADVIGWTNDLADAATAHEGQLDLVDVLVREQGCDRGEAAAIARAMIEDRLDDFDTTTQQLLAAHPHTTGTRERIELLRTFLTGAVTWQHESQRYRAPLPAQRPAGPRPPVDPAEAAALRLERRLPLSVAAGGAVRDHCAGRVLETALLLALLRTRATHDPEQRQLSAYLEQRRPAADPLDALFIDACLHPSTLPPNAADAARSVAGDPTLAGGSPSGRRGRLKRSMLHAVLHVLGGLRLNPADTPEPATGTLSSFTTVNLTAVRILYAHATGYPHTVSTDEGFRLAHILNETAGRLAWESSAATHLLGLHALNSHRPAHPLIEQAVSGLLLARDLEGGVPFLDSQDVWLSAVAGLAFLQRPALRRYTPRMGTFVAAWQAPDGGWPFASGIQQTDVDTATRCMEFLHTLDPHRYRHHLDRGAAYLATKAAPDGGFPTWQQGDHPDLDMTAGAVLALAPHTPSHTRLTAAATRFILDAQHEDGTWTPSWTRSEASVILRALDALHTARTLPGADLARIHAATTRATARLLTTQQPDGGWGHTPDHDSDTLSTAQALPVIARHGPPHATTAALAHLLSRQDETGSFPAPPDQVGPRPLPFDYPVVADLHTLTALNRTTPGALLRAPARPRPRTPGKPVRPGPM
ncbi:prenyltransferase/squalene oxidase repeat-containing protein [Streptomyces sp. NPDC002886]|uniref:terpene synthase family protein n=1 Tax=Streptomyces sp. NPDC002886 TaxID=3364667 RepID=UPI0036A0054C